MFTSMNLEAEAKRVKDITTALAYGFGMIINDKELCKEYLYHLIVGNVGVFNDAPIHHLHHDNIPLVSHLWEPDMFLSFYENQCIYVLTDGEFEFPDNWVQSGRRYGPIFSDQQLQFHGTRFKINHIANDGRLLLDLFTASAVPGAAPPTVPFNFNYWALKIHNPQYLNNYKGRGGRRGEKLAEVGPYNDWPPSPFLGPPPAM